MSREQLVEQLHQLGGVLSGAPGVHSATGNEIARGFALRLAVCAMGFLKPAYVTKAQGGTDEAGEKWQPLAPSTIIKRMNKGKNKTITQRMRNAKKQLEHASENMAKATTFRRGLIAEARQHAAEMKSERAVNKYVQAVKSIEILRDTGRLFNSLSPGVHGAIQPDGELSIQPGIIVFGTNVKYAKYHHSDEPRKLKADGTPRLPQRRLWAKPSRWPESWWRQLRDECRKGILQALKLMFRGAA